MSGEILRFARKPLPLTQLFQFNEGGMKIRVFLKDGSIRAAHTTVVWKDDCRSLVVYDNETRKAINPAEITGWLEAAQ